MTGKSTPKSNTPAVKREETVQFLDLTAAQVRKVGAFDVKATAETVKREHKLAADMVGGAMWDSALFTHYVVETDPAIGKGREWESQNAYAAAMGWSKGYVTALKNLGRAVVVFGVRKGSADWTLLAGKIDKSHAAKVREAVNGDDADAFKAAVDALREEERQRALKAAGKREPRNLGGSTGEDEGTGEAGNGGATPTAPEGTTVATPKQILDAVDNLAKHADRETWAMIETRLATIVEREVRLRAKADRTVKGEVVKSA